MGGSSVVCSQRVSLVLKKKSLMRNWKKLIEVHWQEKEHITSILQALLTVVKLYDDRRSFLSDT